MSALTLSSLKHHKVSTIVDIALTYLVVFALVIAVYPLLNRRLLTL